MHPLEVHPPACPQQQLMYSLAAKPWIPTRTNDVTRRSAGGHRPASDDNNVASSETDPTRGRLVVPTRGSAPSDYGPSQWSDVVARGLPVWAGGLPKDLIV